MYSRSNSPTDHYGQFFTSTLNTGQRPGSATIAFRISNENLYSAGIDVTYDLAARVKLILGYAFSDTQPRHRTPRFCSRAATTSRSGFRCCAPTCCSRRR